MSGLQFLLYFLRRGFRSFYEFRVLNLVTVGVIAISLLVCCLFMLVVHNLSGLLDDWGRDVQLSAYFHEDVDDGTVFELKEEIEEMPEVARVTFISKEEALSSFSERLAGLGTLIDDLEYNPLPASLEVRLIDGMQEPGKVEQFARGLEGPAFEHISYSQEWVERFYAFLNILRLSGLVLGGVLLLGAAFVISQTIKLAIYARREELLIVELVGGTKMFIRAPFLVEGALQGLLGSLGAVAGLVAIYRLTFARLQENMGLQVTEYFLSFLPPSYLFGVIVIGVGLGLLASWGACGRFLDVSV